MFIKNRPSWINIVFMLPYPFFCFGCFTSSSCNIEFDNNTKTLTIKTWPGYLYCCSKTTQIIEYNSIGNIGYGKSSCNQNHEPLYYPIIVLKDGHILHTVSLFLKASNTYRHLINYNVLSLHTANYQIHSNI